MDEDELLRQDMERAARGLTPDQEEFVELDRRRGEAIKERIHVNALLTGFDFSARDEPPPMPPLAPITPEHPPIARVHMEGVPYLPPSEEEAAVLRQRLAALNEEIAVLEAQIARLDKEIHPPAA